MASKLSEDVCTATIVGPRVVMTAAHCAVRGASFKYAGKRYPVRFVISKDYATFGHDLGVAITDTDITDARFANIGGNVQRGDRVSLLGYGCTGVGGKGPRGSLLLGPTTIRRLRAGTFVSREPGGGALCYGDSGGPAFLRRAGERYLVGVNARGNMKDLNVNVRLDSLLSQRFIKKVVETYKLEVCGVTMNCPSPRMRVRLEGFVTTSEEKAGKGALALARTKVVRDALVAKGIDGDRLEAVGLGTTRPPRGKLYDEGASPPGARVARSTSWSFP